MLNRSRIFLTLTTKCNVFCEKCFNRPAFGYGKEMDIQTLEQCFNFLKQYRNTLILGTGESLIADNFDSFINWVKSSNVKQVIILTNGKALCSNRNNIFHDKIKYGITFDGFCQKDVEGLQFNLNIEEVKHNIIQVRNKFPSQSLYLNYTLTNRNYLSLLELYSFAKKQNISELYITALKVFENTKVDKLLPLIPNVKSPKVLQVLKKLYCAARKDGIHVGLPKFSTINTKREMKNCPIDPIIHVDGMVSFCSGRESTCIGHISERNLIDKWLQVKYHPAWCQDCKANVIDVRGVRAVPDKYK